MLSRRVLYLAGPFVLMAACLLSSSGAAEAPVGRLEFVVHTADGKDVKGPLHRLGPGWAVELGGEQRLQVGGQDLVTLRRAAAALPAFPRTPGVVLANGDHLP